MFPEFLCMDLTFGTNKERRPLFMLAGVDGYNRSFTCFRAFLPSKEARALRWVILKALPTLMGTDILKHVSVIATDQEDSLAQSISAAKNLGILPHVKQRQDYFHLFVQPFKDAVRNDTDVTDTIFKWVRTFFDKIESEAEFKESTCLLFDFLRAHESDLGATLSPIIEIIERVITNIEDCGHHFFLKHSTYGFKGDTPVEALNTALKYGAIAVDARMGVDVSGMKQMDKVELKTHEDSM